VTDSHEARDTAPQRGEATDAREQTPEDQRLMELEAALAESEQQAQEYLDGWQRERAAFANYRRRTDEERGSITRTATEDLVCQLLPLLDDLDRACEGIPEEASSHPWVQGVALVQRRFRQVLESLGVEEIEATGCKFDPEVHEAITHEETTKHDEGEVIGEVLKGYRMGDRVLRCSVVRVAKAV